MRDNIVLKLVSILIVWGFIFLVLKFIEYFFDLDFLIYLYLVLCPSVVSMSILLYIKKLFGDRKIKFLYIIALVLLNYILTMFTLISTLQVIGLITDGRVLFRRMSGVYTLAYFGGILLSVLMITEVVYVFILRKKYNTGKWMSTLILNGLSYIVLFILSIGLVYGAIMVYDSVL